MARISKSDQKKTESEGRSNEYIKEISKSAKLQRYFEESTNRYMYRKVGLNEPNSQ